MDAQKRQFVKEINTCPEISKFLFVSFLLKHIPLALIIITYDIIPANSWEQPTMKLKGHFKVYFFIVF
jgi:hypothetical protein